MDYGTRYHVARLAAWVMLATAFLGLLYTAGSASSSRLLGILLLIVGVVGGIACSILAIYSKAKQTHHEDWAGARLLSAYGEDLRRQHAQGGLENSKDDHLAGA